MQIAWVVTDRDCTILTTQNLFVRGEHKVSRYVPHKITTEYANEHGVDPQEAMDLFMNDVVKVTNSGGRVVAHNAAFDMDVVDRVFATHHIAAHPQFTWDASFCTMKDNRIINHCGLKRRGGRALKFPKLEELYTRMHGSPPTVKLHDALGDVHVLRDSFAALLQQGVITFTPSHGAYVCPPGVCDMLVNASDVSVIAGMMSHFGKHPALVADRVLARCGSKLGVRLRALRPTIAELQCAHTLVQAFHKASTCDSVSVLGKRERELHREVDATPGIRPEVATQAKRMVTSKLNSVYGTAREKVVVREHQIENNNAQTYYLCGGEVGQGEAKKWGIVGRVDGFSDGKVVEIKHRRHRIFTTIPSYERVQVEVYMRMTERKTALFIQKLEAGGSTTQSDDVKQDDELWEYVLGQCQSFFQKLLHLIGTPDLWDRWNSADTEEDRQHIWDLIQIS
jgi:DNA polymerase III epsilon subunit-like protein